LNFEDERYVRVYTRDTSTWQFLRWEGQAVFTLLLRKVDRVGVFDLCGADPVEAVAAMLNMPEEVARAGVERLLKYGVLERGPDCLVVAKFIEAQESSMSPTARQKESRLRRRDQIRAGLDPSARATVIYFLQSEHGGSIKIGRSDDLAKRLVGLQTSRPDKLVVLASAPGTLAQESELHAMFAQVREKGEWFSPTPELMAYVKNVAKSGAIVTSRDTSRIVTAHETSAVTPCLAVPNQPEEPPVVPPRADPPVKPAAKQVRHKPRTQAPETLEPTAKHRQVASERGVDVLNEIQRCLSHHKAKGNLMADWNATVTTWLLGSEPRGKPPGMVQHQANLVEASRRPELQLFRPKAVANPVSADEFARFAGKR
jgi:hypothetical protein